MVAWSRRVQQSWMVQTHKLEMVKQKCPKTWEEVNRNDRVKLGIDAKDPLNCFDWRWQVRQAPSSGED